MPHYFTDNTNLESDIQPITFYYKNETIYLKSDIGVFSKERVDYGTRVLLDAVEIDVNIKSLLDVGCGYGPIGISLKKVYPYLNVMMCDVNNRAISLAKAAIELNQLDESIKVIESDGYDQIKDTFDCILTNPPIRAGKSVVSRILKDSYEHLNVHGSIYAVLQKKQGAPSAKKLLEETFGNCEIVKRDKGYYILKSTKK